LRLPRKFSISIADFRRLFATLVPFAGNYLRSTIAIRKSKINWRPGDYAPASASENVPGLLDFASTPFDFGGKGIRTPDFQLAKLALYQLSYAPAGNFEFRLPIFDCKGIKAKCRMSLKRVDIRHALFLLSVLL
jgi:hypothetical protein